MIRVNNILKTYPGNVTALDGISFEISKGEICGYIGTNGAGKSTTVKIIAGMLEFDKGSVFVGDLDLKENPVDVKKIIGFVPESGNMFNSLTSMEFLSFIGRVRDLESSLLEHRVNAFAELFGFADMLNTSLASLSKGNKQKVLISSALLHNPEVILLDEPLNGLDADSIFVFQDLIKVLSLKGKTILYCSHLLDVIEKISSKIILIDKGKIVIDKDTTDLKSTKDYTNLENLFKGLNPETEKKKFSYNEIFG